MLSGSMKLLFPAARQMLVQGICILSVALHAQQTCFEEDWRWGGFGYVIGSTGTIAYDLDGNGFEEIVTTSYSHVGPFERYHYWHVIEFDPAAGDFRAKYLSDSYNIAFDAIGIHDFNDDGIADILLATFYQGCYIHVFSGLDFTELDYVRMDWLSSPVQHIDFADLDLDGDIEVIIAAGDLIFIGTEDLSELLYTSAPPGTTTAIEIGNVDADSFPEILMGNQSVFRVFQYNNDVLTEEWTLIDDGSLKVFGGAEFIQVVDYDGDGLNEVCVSYFRQVDLLDVRQKSKIWSNYTLGQYKPIGIRDFNNDGKGDFFLLGGLLQVVDIASDQVFYSTQLTGVHFSLQDIGFYNLSQNSAEIYLIGDGWFLDIWRMSPDTLSHIWPTIPQPRNFSLFRVDDVDLDGKPELIVIEAYSHLSIVDIDDPPLTQSVSLPLFGSPVFLETGNIDADPQPEILINYREDQIVVIDGVDLTVQRQYVWLPDHGEGIILHDYDQNGKPEVMISYAPLITDFEGPYLRRLHLESGSDTGISAVDKPVYLMASGDTDDDGWDELILVSGTEIRRLTKQTYESFDKLSEFRGYALSVQNVDADSQEEILVGTFDGRIVVYDVLRDTLEANVALTDQPILSLDAIDINGDYNKEIVCTQWQDIYLVDVTTSTVECIAGTANVYFGGPKGDFGVAPYSLHNGPNFEAGDFNGDGWAEVLASSFHAIHHFTTNLLVGVEDRFPDETIQMGIVENPVYDFLRLRLGQEMSIFKGNLEIFDTNGRLISLSSMEIDDQTGESDVSHLTPGLYFIRLRHHHRSSQIQKFVKF